MINKEKLLEFLSSRIQALNYQTENDVINQMEYKLQIGECSFIRALISRKMFDEENK